MKAEEYLYVAISLDIDPDANNAVKGRHDALSSPTENGTVRIDACRNGLQRILELLDTYNMDATLFYEARTAQMLIADGIDLPKLSERHEVSCHSLKHEDFLGKVSGLPMEGRSIEEVVAMAKDILEKIFGRPVKGFRAPYTRTDRTVVKILEELGFQYDSSETVLMNSQWTGKPFPLEIFDVNLLELALPSFHDEKGKRMSSYLWAIFEGKRLPREYVDMVLRAKELAKGGLFIFAIHPWHLYVNHHGSPFRKEQVIKNLNGMEYILSQLRRTEGIRIVRQDRYLENWLAEESSIFQK